MREKMIGRRVRNAAVVLSAFLCAMANAQVTYPFYDGFEAGNYGNWTVGTGSYTRTVTNAVAASGTYSFTMTGGNGNMGDGVSATFATAQKPLNVSFSVRSSSALNYAGFFSLCSGATNVVLFYMNTSGYFYLNNGQTTKSYLANTWYNIRFVLNWTAQTVDLYVDNVLVSSGVLMYSTTATSVDNIKLYNYSSGAQAWWDNITVGDVPRDSAKQIRLVPVSSPTYNRRPVFKWFHNDSVSAYKITAALTPSFGTSLFTVPLADTSFQPSADLPFDSIYWKVEDYSSTKFWSTVSTFLVIDSLQPVISLSPASLKVTVGDTATRPLSICNTTGRSPLTYRFSGTGGDSTRILVWTYGTSSSSTQYNNILAAIRQYNPNVAFTNYAAVDSASLRSTLADKNVFLIPEQDGSGISSTYGSILRNVLTDFVNRGGKIVCCYPYTSSMYTFLNNTGLVSISYTSYTSTYGYSLTLRTPLPSLLSGITGLATQNATSYFSVSGADTANVLATYSSYAVVFQKSIGNGSLAILGIDFNTYDSSWAKVISRAATGVGAVLPSWLSLSPDSGTVAAGKCATVNLHFAAGNLASGTYMTALSLQHNSPFSHTPIAVPCTLVVPQTTMSYTPTSFRLTLNTGDTASRILTLGNTGAARLSYDIRGAAAGGAIIINELMYDQTTYDEITELWNRGGNQDMTGWRLVWNDDAGTSGSYTFPSGVVFKSGRTLSCMVGSGANNDSMVFVGVNIAWVTGTQLSVSLYNAGGKAVDFVHTSVNTDVAPTGTAWKGAGVLCSSCVGLARNSNNDNDTASDWTALTSASSYSLFSLNAGQSPAGGVISNGWLSVANAAGNVAAGGNAVATLKFNATSMIYSGTFVDSIMITHNASNYASPLVVRCTLVVVSTIPALVHFTPNPTSIRRPKLAWHPVASSSSYTIQLAADASFSSPILVQPTTDTFFLPLIDLPLGPIYWKVKSALSANYSLPDAFVIQSDSIPNIIPVVPDTVVSARPKLVWNKTVGASVYRLQIDLTGNFTNPWSSILLSDTFYIPSVNIPVGRVCWRVSNYTYNETIYSAVDTFWVKGASDVKFKSTALPKVFAMGHVWPNPFIASTVIPIAVPTEGKRVSLVVYDISGRVMRVVQDGPMKPGYYNVVFDGKDRNDRELSPGNYFCKMVSGKYQKTIYLLKIK